MKVAVVNFSGNVGKSMIVRHLLAPRMKAPEFTVDVSPVGPSGGESVHFAAKDFARLQDRLVEGDSAIVDVSTAGTWDFIAQMGVFAGSHENFDGFLVPVLSDRKQQADTIKTIDALARLGVPAKKIQVVFNKVDRDEVSDLRRLFYLLFEHHDDQKNFTLRPRAVIVESEVFEALWLLQRSVAQMASDETDYREQLRDAHDAQDGTKQQRARQLMVAQLLAHSMDDVMNDIYEELFQ